MKKVECPWCGDIRESPEYFEDGSVGKLYCGIAQLFCLECGMSFEIKQSEFLGWGKGNENQICKNS